MTVRARLAILLVIPAPLLAEPYPELRKIAESDGWKQREVVSKRGEADFLWEYEDAEKYMQANDINADGKIDYLRLQKPLHSFNHYVWLDTDHDGFFDKQSIGHEGKCHIAVPALGTFATPPHELLGKELDMQSAESVGRHFLLALAKGNRTQAEALTRPDTGFWNGVGADDFPIEGNHSKALREAASGKLTSKDAPREDINLAHLELGGVAITLQRDAQTGEWKFFPGHLFGTRHLTSMLRGLPSGQAEEQER